MTHKSLPEGTLRYLTWPTTFRRSLKPWGRGLHTRPASRLCCMVRLSDSRRGNNTSTATNSMGYGLPTLRSSLRGSLRTPRARGSVWTESPSSKLDWRTFEGPPAKFHHSRSTPHSFPIPHKAKAVMPHGRPTAKQREKHGRHNPNKGAITKSGCGPKSESGTVPSDVSRGNRRSPACV